MHFPDARKSQVLKLGRQWIARNMLRALKYRTYGKLIEMINQLIWMRAKYLRKGKEHEDI